MRPYSARAFRDRLQRELSDVNGRLYQAEERLWEISLNPESADMLLPPSILHAAMREAQKHHRAEPPLPRTLSPRHQRQQQIGHLQLANVKPPHEPRPPAARRSLALASRADVLATEAALDRRVAAEGETVAAFDAAFEALVEQVRAQCVERGELLGRVRSWLLRHVWWQEHELRAPARLRVTLGALRGDERVVPVQPRLIERCRHLGAAHLRAVPLAGNGASRRAWQLNHRALGDAHAQVLLPAGSAEGVAARVARCPGRFEADEAPWEQRVCSRRGGGGGGSRRWRLTSLAHGRA